MSVHLISLLSMKFSCFVFDANATDVMLHENITCIFFCIIQPAIKITDTFDFLFYLGFTARQNYFIHFEPSQSLGGAKLQIPKKKHLTTCKQNMACLTCDPS